MNAEIGSPWVRSGCVMNAEIGSPWLRRLGFVDL